MSEQFVSVITNEAMCKICYDGGWQLKPFMFFVSQTDILDHFSEEEIFSTSFLYDTSELFEFEEVTCCSFSIFPSLV